MKIYLSWVVGMRARLHWFKLKEILTAFPEMQHKKPEMEKRRIDKLQWIEDLFLDSWWFSIRNSWLDLDVKDYLSFIKKYWHLFTIITNMDTADEKETLENQKLLETSWHYIMPVFHYWDRPELLEEYCKKYDYVWLWGMAGVVINQWQLDRFLSFCFSVAVKYKTKFHWFWMTSFPLLIKYPFYSVDSTSWLAYAKFNNVLIFKGNKIQSINAWKYRELYGVDFAKKSNDEKIRFWFEQWLKLKDYVTKLHKVKKMDYWNL